MYRDWRFNYLTNQMAWIVDLTIEKVRFQIARKKSCFVQVYQGIEGNLYFHTSRKIITGVRWQTLNSINY